MSTVTMSNCLLINNLFRFKKLKDQSIRNIFQECDVISWRVSTNNFSLALFGLEPNLSRFVFFLSLLNINDVSLDGFMKLFEHLNGHSISNIPTIYGESRVIPYFSSSCMWRSIIIGFKIIYIIVPEVFCFGNFWVIISKKDYE